MHNKSSFHEVKKAVDSIEIDLFADDMSNFSKIIEIIESMGWDYLEFNNFNKNIQQ